MSVDRDMWWSVQAEVDAHDVAVVDVLPVEVGGGGGGEHAIDVDVVQVGSCFGLSVVV